jgi:hypothetical protein
MSEKQYIENADADNRQFMPAALFPFTCDRCSRKFVGLKSTLDAPVPLTGGFYDLTSPGCWTEYARGNEKIVCDECMYDDPKFQVVLRAGYGFSV